MIERIIIENFKSLRTVDLSLGRLNLFIGTNASGKSNFLDALRVLQGIGNGFTLSEVLDGKPRGTVAEVWEGIRGGSSNAITAAFFQPDMPGIMTIEEIESGVHPSRLRLLVELFRNRTGHGATQVFATTHSPTTLAWLQDADYRTTFVCKRDDKDGRVHDPPADRSPSLQGCRGEVSSLGTVR